jgi:hypothetical protein
MRLQVVVMHPTASLRGPWPVFRGERKEIGGEGRLAQPCVALILWHGSP